MERINDMVDIEAGLAALRQADPRLLPIIEMAGPLPLRRSAPGFAGLAQIVVSQQVSKASAAAMFGRLERLVAPLDAANLLALGDAPMIEAGLSRAKQETLNGIALAVVEDDLDLEALCSLPPQQAADRLTAIKGIGPWTAEVYLLFCAGHRDIFPAGDVALRHAVGEGLGLSERPDAETVRHLARRWSPWRGVAARLFWAYYAALKNGRDAVPL